MSGAASTTAGTGWPARIIHVNEDGWVLINRGSAQGVAAGLRLLVVTRGTRELRDLYRGEDAAGHSRAPHGDEEGGPVVLRFRRTFELLEVIHAERECAIAIAARVPVERRPTVYHGSDGDLMVWVPLPANYTYPQATSATDDDDDNYTTDDADETENANAGDPNSASANPVGSVDQEDEPWEQALPLNGLHVGDWVTLALPVAPQAAGSGAHATTPGEAQTSATTVASRNGSDQPYDWIKL